MKVALYILVGAVLMYIILKFVSDKPTVSNSEMQNNFKKLLETSEAVNVLASDQFANLLLTPEFKNLMKGISDQYLQTITQSLIKGKY